MTQCMNYLGLRRVAARAAILGLCASLGSLATGCFGGYPKQPPIDLTDGPGPVATDFSSETTLEARYPTVILPGYQAAVQDGYFNGVPGPDGNALKIHYAVFQVPNEKGAIVFLPGRTEPILKHAENILDLMNQGYSVYAIDHRGQGASGRMTPDPQMGYVEYFKDYVTDVTTFVNTVVVPGKHSNLFLLAHSLGGGIAAEFVFENPDMFKAVVLSSPMLGINTAPYPEFVAQNIADPVCQDAGQAMTFAIGQTDFDPTAQFTDPSNDVTRSLARFTVKMEMFNANPTLQLGGVSYRWLCESLGETLHLQTLGTFSNTPTLLFQAGNDDVVTLPAENQYCNDAAACQIQPYSDSYHEVLSERDSIRNDALSKTVRFFNHFATE